MFIAKEKLLVKMIGQSFFSMPYHIHKAKPIIRVTTITIEMSVAFLSFIIFTSCGKDDMPVSMPATLPIIVCSSMLFYIKRGAM